MGARVERPLVTCTRCGGHGTVPLVPSLLETLLAIERHSEVTASGLRKVLVDDTGKPLRITALHNRLVELESLGLVRRTRKTGRFAWWASTRPRARLAPEAP